MPPKDSLKRKDAPTKSQRPQDRNRSKRAKLDIAREIRVQPADKALNDRKELDVASFVHSHQYEIRALEESITNSRAVLSTRAFQQVPRQMRRRTASHNVKKVPRRLRPRAAREMKEDNTPTGRARRKAPTSKQHLRRDVAKIKAANRKNDDLGEGQKSETASKEHKTAESTPIIHRKFKKRQLDKSWLPTHMFHAKRAHMTPPLEPLWRFAIPLTPTEKNYRVTNRSMNNRGCVAWDMSYISSISASGDRKSLIGLLRCLNVPELYLTGETDRQWRSGLRTWTGWVRERDNARDLIAPVIVLWDPPPEDKASDEDSQVLFRVHPSAHLQLWEELVKLSRMQRPKLSVQDLRFELGSIEVAGPAATEAITAILRLIQPNEDLAALWKHVPAVTNVKALPTNTVLGLTVSDPRLDQPHETVHIPSLEDRQEHDNLQQILANWQTDHQPHPHALLSLSARTEAVSKLPSQKSINRRRGDAPAGSRPVSLPTDPSIPALIYTNHLDLSNAASQATSKSVPASSSWTILLPWQAVLPIWTCLMYYPLSTGDRPRFGGVKEIQQRHFETNTPWFPGDFPCTKAGREWEQREREIAMKEWKKRPPNRRTNYETLDLGNGEKGEVGGDGWACGWENLEFSDLQDSGHPKNTQDMLKTLVPVALNFVGRGHISRAARIYRLPEGEEKEQWLKKAINKKQHKLSKRKSRNPGQHLEAKLESTLAGLGEGLATMSAGQSKAEDMPVPRAKDLAGFVTQGSYNLSEGRATAVGSVLLAKLKELDGLEKEEEVDRMEGVQQDRHGHVQAHGVEQTREVQSDAELSSGLCIVRDVGTNVARLARWNSIPQRW